MGKLELTRSPDDRRLYVLEGVGTLRLEGWGSRAARAEAGSHAWQLARRGILGTCVEATDAAGTVAGRFDTRVLRRGGTLTWAGRELTLRPDSIFKERYTLADGDDELATIEGRTWGKRPIDVTIAEPSAIDPGVLLFAAFVVRSLAQDAASSS